MINIQVLGTKNNGIDGGLYEGGRGRFYDGIAFDLVEIDSSGQALWVNPNWGTIGDVGESFGFEWGGNWTNFKDRTHFQMTNGNSIKDLLTSNSPCSN